MKRTMIRGGRSPPLGLSAYPRPAQASAGGCTLDPHLVLHLGNEIGLCLPKIKTHLTPIHLQSRSKGLPALDLKPLSTPLRPSRSSAWAVRAPIRLPAIVFQITNG